jgi:hypothetical protein
MKMEHNIDFSQIISVMRKKLPKHECAYCVSSETQIMGINEKLSSDGYLCFRVCCNSCRKEDLPAIPHDFLKSIFMFF